MSGHATRDCSVAPNQVFTGADFLCGCADLVLFTATANVSIVALNLSLMINQVGFYQVRSMLRSGNRGNSLDWNTVLTCGGAQVAKLLIIPFVCLVERCWLGRVFTKPVILSMLTVVAGVAVV